MTTLVIGGSSGLGLELAKKAKTDGKVYVTGRSPIQEEGITFSHLDINDSSSFKLELESILKAAGHIDTLIYAAGFFQDGTVTDLSDEQVSAMMNVGVMAAIYTTKYIVERQGKLTEFVAITSTSQWTPRLYEPIYTAAKAALGAYANSLSLDERVGKVLVAGPAGMATNFWRDADEEAHDTSTMLNVDWVVDQIQDLRSQEYDYMFAKILRQPPRVEIAEKR